MNVKKSWFERIKKPYLLSIPVVVATAVSSYSVIRNLEIVSSQDTNSLARLPLTFVNGNVHGKSISDASKNKFLDEDRARLTSYYRSHNPENINVSSETSSNANNLFIHYIGQSQSENPNNFWLDNVRLNQLSIDRYGYEYDDSGNKKTNSSASLHSIVKWSDIDIDNVYKSDEYRILPSFSFRFFNTDISKQEVEILSYTKDDKYKLEESDVDISKDWFVWIDKDLLSIKLNYALQTYVFNQSGAQNENSIKSIIGEVDQTKNNDKQKYKKELSVKNYTSLPEEYKIFAKDYIQTFLDANATESTANWSSVVNYVTAKDSFIKPQDLNKIYNRFKKQNKGLELFKSHLITKITSGDIGNWKISLNLLKGDSSLREYEARAITKKASSIIETEEEKKKNSISLFMDPDTNKEINMNEVFNLVSKYSVRYFYMPENIEEISSAYSSSDDSASKEILHVLSFKHNNEFGIYSHQKWIPFIMAAVFLLGVLVYLIVSFKSPGAIIGVSAISTTVNVAGAFFALGSKLSLMGVFAFFIGILYSLFIGYYLLSFLKKVFSIEFLDTSNIWSVFKRGLVTVTDVSLPCFIFSSFLVFFAPDKFREFGIVMSMFVLFSYVLISVFGCLMALNRACGNIIGLSYVFNSQSDSEDGYFKLCDIAFSKKLFLHCALFIFPAVIIAGIIVFSIIGFNSFSLLKENFLVIADTKPESAISGNKIANLGNSSVYLTRENPSGLNPSSTVMSTRSFGDFFTISDLLSAISFAYAPISFYVLVRFKFKGILILLLNTVFPFLLFVSAILLFRVPITSSIFLSFCAFLSLSIFYNISFLSLDGQNKILWYSPFISDIRSKMFKQIKWSIIWCVSILAITCVTSFWVVALFFGAAIICAHSLIIFFHKFLGVLIREFLGIYMQKYNFLKGEENLNYKLDFSEEEIIEGINK